MKTKSVGFVVGLCAGGVGSVAFGGEGSPTKLEPSRGLVVDVAHIYFNIMSGERVVTLLGEGEVAGADNGDSSYSFWSARVANPCEAEGFTTEFFFLLDDNSGTTSLATNSTAFDWGDIRADTLIDCVHLDWVTDHDDVDLDGDGVGDGVEGLGGQWTFWDTLNGRMSDMNSLRLPIVSFMFTDLPGDISGTSDPDDPNNIIAGYSVDVDLEGQFSSSLIFEIGDIDGDLQGASYGNSDVDGNGPIGSDVHDRDFNGEPDNDLDGDGLFDWGWSVRFFQPGTTDLDDDGVIDGGIEDSYKGVGMSFGAAAGEAIDNGDGTWTWELATQGEGVGLGSEDAFAMTDENGVFAGTFWFGGLTCTAYDNGQYGPGASFEMELFGPSPYTCLTSCGCDAADLAEPFDHHSFFDVSAFLGAYNTMDDAADIAEPFGEWNFFDVSAFLGEYNDGCP